METVFVASIQAGREWEEKGKERTGESIMIAYDP